MQLFLVSLCSLILFSPSTYSRTLFIPVSAFVDLVHSTNGTTQRGADYGVGQDHEPKTIRSPRKREKKNVSAVPSHFVQTDVSQIKGDTSMLSDMVFCILNYHVHEELYSVSKLFLVLTVRFPVILPIKRICTLLFWFVRFFFFGMCSGQWGSYCT